MNKQHYHAHDSAAEDKHYIVLEAVTDQIEDYLHRVANVPEEQRILVCLMLYCSHVYLRLCRSLVTLVHFPLDPCSSVPQWLHITIRVEYTVVAWKLYKNASRPMVRMMLKSPPNLNLLLYYTHPYIVTYNIVMLETQLRYII